MQKARKKREAPLQDTLDVIGIDAITERIAECVSLRVIAAECGVSIGKLLSWLSSYPEQYASAHIARADTFADEILQIADDGSNDTYQTDDGEVTNHDVIARSRLRVDARKWLASKMAPKKYGDKLDVVVNNTPLVIFKDFTGTKPTLVIENG